MKALVTGASGFVGSHLADLLLSAGYELRCNIRKTSSRRWLEGKNIEIVEASLSDKASLIEAVKDVDIIYHVAGLTFAKNAEAFMRGNRDGTRNLIEAAYEHNPGLKRFLFVSSQTVAGPARSLDRPSLESDEARPITSYGKSKKAAEDVVLEYKDKLPITIARAPAVFGPRDTAIYSVFKGAKAGLATVVGVRQKKYVSLIHVRDLVRGIKMAAESDKSIGETYFVSSSEFYNWPQIMGVIKEKMGKSFMLTLKLPHVAVLVAAAISDVVGRFQSKPPVFNYEKGIDFIQNYWICSADKARCDFGWRQEMTLEEGLSDTINWYKENKWL